MIQLGFFFKFIYWCTSVCYNAETPMCKTWSVPIAHVPTFVRHCCSIYEENLFGTSPSRGEVNMQNKKSMHFMLVLFKFLWNMSNNTVLKSWRETNVCYRYKCQDLCCWGYCFLFYVDREENRVLDHVSMNNFDSY